MLKRESFCGIEGPSEKVKNCFTPIREKVLVQLVNPELLQGKIKMPDQAREGFKYGTMAYVVAVGPECKQVQVGQLLLFKESTMGRLIEWNKIELMALEECEIACIVNEKERQRLITEINR